MAHFKARIEFKLLLKAYDERARRIIDAVLSIIAFLITPKLPLSFAL